jgi:hypothetical protein
MAKWIPQLKQPACYEIWGFTLPPQVHRKLQHWWEVMCRLTFSIWPFKRQFSAVATLLFNLNSHCGTVFSLSDEKDVHLMGQHCAVCLLKVKCLLWADIWGRYLQTEVHGCHLIWYQYKCYILITLTARHVYTVQLYLRHRHTLLWFADIAYCSIIIYENEIIRSLLRLLTITWKMHSTKHEKIIIKCQ